MTDQPSTALARLEAAGEPAPLDLEAARAYIARAVLDRDPEVLAEIRSQARGYEAYYSQREAARDLANDYGEVKVRAERGLGRLDTEAHPRGRPPKDWAPQAFTSGVATDTRAAWRRLAAMAEDQFERYLADARADQVAGVSTARVLRGPGPHVANNGGVSEWYTPADIVAAVTDVLGRIDLDPASSEAANKIVGASVYYTAEEDGLTRPWGGLVYLNPPYTQPAVVSFATRLADEFRAGNITAAVALTNNATETAWWQVLSAAASAVCFPAGRLGFTDPEGNEAHPLQGQAIVYLGPDPGAFVTRFALFGECWRRAPRTVA